MKHKLMCPACMSADTKRIIFEWSIREFVIVVLFILLLAERVTVGSIGDWGITDWSMFQIAIVIGTIALIVFPVILNLRFPRYKCKSCGRKFKPNGEDAEDVFDDY